MNKIIGLVTAWGGERWIRPSIEQALEYCDDIMVCVVPFYKGVEKFEDKTREIADHYRNRINIIELSWWKNVRSFYLNKLLERSHYYEVGNWVWLLDIDEFYPLSAYNLIRKLIEDGSFNFLQVEEKFFYINMKHYLKGIRNRLFRIDSIKDNYFSPIDNWSGKSFQIGILPREAGLFHYSLLVNNRLRSFRWEKFEKNQEKTKWYELIYKNYDLECQDYWVDKNFELFGILSPWPDNTFEPKNDGSLFEWKGGHPEIIERENLPSIEDFRTIYDG